jgi:hypothetical protein
VPECYPGTLRDAINGLIHFHYNPQIAPEFTLTYPQRLIKGGRRDKAIAVDIDIPVEQLQAVLDELKRVEDVLLDAMEDILCERS